MEKADLVVYTGLSKSFYFEELYEAFKNATPDDFLVGDIDQLSLIEELKNCANELKRVCATTPCFRCSLFISLNLFK